MFSWNKHEDAATSSPFQIPLVFLGMYILCLQNFP